MLDSFNILMFEIKLTDVRKNKLYLTESTASPSQRPAFSLRQSSLLNCENHTKYILWTKWRQVVHLITTLLECLKMFLQGCFAFEINMLHLCWLTKCSGYGEHKNLCFCWD